MQSAIAVNIPAAFEPGASPGELGPDMEMHNPEIAYMFALGLYFSIDSTRRAAYRARLERAYALAVALDVTRPPRAFNWAFQFSSQLVYFAERSGEGSKKTA